MKHQAIDSSSRVWVVTRGPDGRLAEEIDPHLLPAATPELAEEIADSLLRDARSEIARTRLW